jgi:hypothetical protein
MYFNISKIAIPAIPKTPVINEVTIFTGSSTLKSAPKKLKNKSIINPTREFKANFKSNLSDFPKTQSMNTNIKTAIIKERVPSTMSFPPLPFS